MDDLISRSWLLSEYDKRHKGPPGGARKLIEEAPSALGTDCISRQGAIDALAEDMPQAYTPDGSHPADEGIFMAQEIYADCIQTLKELPSAQPEIVRCKDCKHFKYGICKKSGLCVNKSPNGFCDWGERKEVTE